MYIKHSKFKNTGILFEILVKKITSDTLSGKNSKAIKIIKEYFVSTELGKEYKLYETMFKTKNQSEHRANMVLNTILEQSKKINKTKLKGEKYRLIKELKNHYNLEELFKTKLSDVSQKPSSSGSASSIISVLSKSQTSLVSFNVVDTVTVLPDVGIYELTKPSCSSSAPQIKRPSLPLPEKFSNLVDVEPSAIDILIARTSLVEL